MKKNGFTLVEIIVSITLISIIMVFLIKLLVQIGYERTNELYNSANSINRAEIIRTVQNDFMNNNLKSIQRTVANESVTIVLQDSYSTKEGTLKFYKSSNKYYVSYISLNTKKYKWELKTTNPDTYIDLKKVTIKPIFVQVSNANSNLYSSITITVPVIIDSDLNITSSVLDDFVFTFYTYGKKIEYS